MKPRPLVVEPTAGLSIYLHADALSSGTQHSTEVDLPWHWDLYLHLPWRQSWKLKMSVPSSFMSWYWYIILGHICTLKHKQLQHVYSDMYFESQATYFEILNPTPPAPWCLCVCVCVCDGVYALNCTGTCSVSYTALTLPKKSRV